MSLWKAILIVAICVGVFFFVTSSACSTKPDDDDDDTTTDTTDNIAPVIFDWSPANGAEEVSRGATLWVSICDTGEYSTGLNADSISMMVNSAAVVPSLIATASGLDLRYIRPGGFSYRDTVHFSARAVDNAGNAAVGSSVFYIELGDTFSLDFDSLSAISGFVTRSRPDGFTTEALYFSSPSSGYSELTGSPYQIIFTPKRSWILYDPYPEGDIYAFNPPTGARIKLTEDLAEEKYPALSPNGRTLGFARGEDVVLKNLQNSEETVLASSAQGGRELEFSPDGEFLAYRSGSGSYNPKLFIRNVSDGTNVTYSTIYNDVSAFDWSHTHNGIACVVTGNRLYYWDVDGGSYPQLIRMADNIQLVAFDGLDNIYFVEKTPSGDKILKSSISGPPAIALDLTAENATVEALSASSSGELIFAKRSGSTFSLNYLPAGSSSPSVVTSGVGQTLQIQWF